MNSPDLFPPEISDAVDGLAYLGHLEDEVRFCGHRFLLRTLKAGEELEAALLAQEWQDTFGQVKAHAWAHIAASLVAVDGNEDFCPAISADRNLHLRAKFQYITDNWYWSVGEHLFNCFADLVQRQVDAIQAVEDLSSRSLTTSWGTPGSSTLPSDSEEIPTDSSFASSSISPDEMKKLADSEE